MLEQAAVSSPKTEDDGLLSLPLKAADWVLPAFWDGVERRFDDLFCILNEI